MAIKRGINWTIIGIVAMAFMLFATLVLTAQKKDEIVKHRPESRSEAPERADRDNNLDTINTFNATNKELMEMTEISLKEMEILKAELREKSDALKKSERQYERLQKQINAQGQEDKDMESRMRRLSKELDQVKKEQQEDPRGYQNDNQRSLAMEQGRWITSNQLGGEQKSRSLFKRGEKDALKGDPSSYKKKNKKGDEETPLYTIPHDAVLYDAVAWTALVGRIPIDGKNQDAFPAKFMVGKTNLLASGFDLPEIHAMMISGDAFGDWNLSCVRVDIKALTFIYEDGSITTYKKDSGGDVDGSLGYISDRRGFPCVPGVFRSNAPEYIGSTVALAGLGAAGNAYAEKAKTTYFAPGTGAVFEVTRNVDKLVAGEVIDSATKETIDWMTERQQNSFDAVVKEPGALVSIHLTEEIPINTSPEHRKVRYASAKNRHTHLLD